MTDDMKNTLPAVLLAAFGLVLATVITIVLFLNGMRDGKDLVALAGVFTGVTGTLVGLLLGAHVGAAGKAELQADRDHAVRDRDHAVRMKDRAMLRLSPDDQRAVIEEMAESAMSSA